MNDLNNIEDAQLVENSDQEETPLPEESFKQRYDRMVHELVCERHWTPRKARRYLDSIAKRNVKKTIKRGKSMPKTDTSDIDPNFL